MDSKPVKRPVKLIKSFITWVKHACTEEDFPFPYVSTYVSIAAKRLSEHWNSIKEDPEKKKKFIEELKKDAQDLKDKGYLANPRGLDDEED